MAKGTRKGGGANKENNKTLTMNANNTDHSNTKAGSGASKNKSKDKRKIDLEESATNSVAVAQFEETSDPASAKKDHHKVQPTSTQIMLAQLIGGDPMDDLQKTKIQQVMDITGKPEDAVATALFDAGWDEARAIDLLLEDGDHLTAWEETGKKNRKKQKQSTEDGKDENEDSEGFVDPREKSGKRGPPRMRRGGSAQGGDRSFTRNSKTGDMANGDGLGRESGRGRGDQPPRRGGRGGGGTRGGDRSSYSGRGRRGGGGAGRDGVSGTGAGNEGVGGFQGSIDTWNPNGSSGEAGSGTTGSASGKSNQRSRGGPHGSSKDAFDNAGNWGDDFPAADDWDNEEYTGSLADTKVFTASGQGGQVNQGKKGPQSSHPSSKPGQGRSYPQHSQESQPTSVEPVSGPGGGAAPSGAVPPPSSAAVGAPTSTYSQPIDLSTLLHKPTTQSSIGSNSQQTLLQFSQQATDSLKAAVGIGQQPSSSAAASSTKTGDQLYSSYASSAASAGANSNQASYGQGNSAFTSIKSSQQSVAAGKQGAAAQNRSRMPPPSKIPNSAVEMPGDQLGRLDVQFGGLDLQFGGGGSSANSDSVNSFEFNGGPTSTSAAGNGPSSANAEVDVANSKYLSGDKSKVAQPATSSVDNYSNKDKSGLSSAINPSKLASNDGFTDSRKAGSGPNPSSYAPRGQAMDKSNSEAMNSYHGGSSQNYNNYGHSKSSYGQYGSNPNNYQSSYGGSYGQNSYSTSTTTSSNYSKSYASDGKSGFQNDSNLSANPTAVLGLTTSTNVLSGKISATTASNKVNVTSLPPGVASMLPQHYMGLPAAFYGLQQPTPAMYSAYGNPGLEDIAALQRASGLHTLQGYYDPNGQYAATSLPTAAAGNRGDGNATSMNLNSLGSTSASSSSLSAAVTSNTSTVSGGASQQSNSNPVAAGMGSGSEKSAFGNVTASDSTSSPIPSSSHQTMQNTATQQQPPLNFAATNAFAQHQQTALPPGYAYFYPNLPAYGGAGVYPATMAVPTAAGGTGTSQFQKSGGYSYGTGGYDSLGQQGSKDFGGYNSSSGKGTSTNTAAGGAGKGGHQYWGNNLTNSQLW